MAKSIKITVFFILFIKAGFAQQDVCPPNNLTVTPGVNSISVTWQNPGFYYGTHEVSPQNANYHTGSVDASDGFTQTSRIKSQDQEQGWAMFDISSLPAGIEPITVEFNFYVYGTNWPYWSVTPVTSNPLTTGFSALYNDIISGAGSNGINDYGTFNEEEEFSPGPYSYQLIGSVFEDIASTSLTQDWFTIGIVDYDFLEEWYIYLEGWAQPNPPSLTITYGEGERYIVPAIPYPGADAADIAEYKQAVKNNLQEEVETAHAQVVVNNNRTNDRDCLGAWGYYLFMDGDTLLYTNQHEFNMQGTIGQEYCFYVVSEVGVPDSTMVISSDTTQVIEYDSTTSTWDTTYVVTWDTTYDITWNTEYSDPSDTVCGAPVEFLLCSVTDFYSVSSYTELSLNWEAPFAPSHVEAWGDIFGNTELPPGTFNENVTKVSAGTEHILLLRSDSTVSFWPTAGWSQIPDEYNHSFVDIAAGYWFSIGLYDDSTMYGYGWNSSNQAVPPDSITDVVSIAAGYDHAMALRSDGTVVAWGDNTYGQTNVPAGLNNVIQIDAGYYYSAALKSDGTVVAWGYDYSGQSTVPDNLTDVVEISCGGNHMLALKSNGSVVAWGQDTYGQSTVPTNLGGVNKIAAGGYHNMILQNNGLLVGWGRNSNSQTTLPQLFQDVNQISCGQFYTALLIDDAGEDCGTLNGYTVYEDGDSIDFTTARNYTITTLEWEEEACYNIESNYDQGSSAWTDTVCASLITPAFCSSDTLVAESNYDEIELSWDSQEGYYCGTFIGYCVYLDGVPIDTLSDTTYTISDAVYDVDYCYSVTSLYEEGESVSTNSVCISLVTPQLCLPDSISAEPGDNEVTVSWQEPVIFSRNRAHARTTTIEAVSPPFIDKEQTQSGDIKETYLPLAPRQNRETSCGTLLGYTVYQDGDSIAFVGDSITSVVSTGLENGIEYCFSVTATYSQGLSAQSEEVCTIPFAVRRDHDTETIQTSITNQGNIGFTEQAWIDDSTMGNGLGFVFAGNNCLFEAGLLIGTSQDQISDCIRNDLDGFEEDFVEEEGTYLNINTPGSITSEEGTAILNDSGADNPIGIRIKQKSYADEGFETRNGILFRYTLVNENNTEITGLYAGVFFDWDVVDDTVNSAHYDADRQMVYVQDQEASPTRFAGTMLLNVGLGANIDALYNDSDGVHQYSDQSKWMHMSGGVNDESAMNADVSTYTGIGPVDIAAGDTVTFSIAVIAASSVYELEYAAGEIRNFWDTHFPEELGNKDETDLPQVYALHQNYPNPFNPVTSIRYDIPETANVRVDVYSILGQKVKTLVSGTHQPGFYSVQWNGTNDMGKPLASGMYIYRIHSTEFTSVKKLVLMK